MNFMQEGKLYEEILNSSSNIKKEREITRLERSEDPDEDKPSQRCFGDEA